MKVVMDEGCDVLNSLVKYVAIIKIHYRNVTTQHL